MATRRKCSTRRKTTRTRARRASTTRVRVKGYTRAKPRSRRRA